MHIPRRLHPGDTIGIAAVSSPPDLNALQNAMDVFQALGLSVRLGKYVDQVYGYLAGTDEERVEDFHQMMADPEIKAIFFACGGYGSGRIAPLLDYRLIYDTPKILWGYSDLTYLFTAIRQTAGLIAFHGPMPASDFGKTGLDVMTAESFRQLFAPEMRIYDESISPLTVLAHGEAEGELVGGNLSTLVSTLGTPFEIMTEGRLLFIEDVNEEPYRIDSMLQQLTYAGKLSEVRGILIGDFKNATPQGPRPSFQLAEVLEEYFGRSPVPVMKGFQIGHCTPHYAIPLGVKAYMSTEKKKLTVHPGVS